MLEAQTTVARSSRRLRARGVGSTDPGCMRKRNEDALRLVPDLGLFVVADGIGGHAAGEIAAELAVETITEAVEAATSSARPSLCRTAGARLSDAVRRASARVYEASQQRAEHAGMGTTIVAALLCGTHMAIAHVGDSRAYLLRGGTLTRLTEDHTVRSAVKQGALPGFSESEAAPMLSWLTRAVGLDSAVDVDVRQLEPKQGDVLLLCSDGLTCMLDDDEIATILREEQVLHVAVERLIARANEAGGPDNVTVLLVEWGL